MGHGIPARRHLRSLGAIAIFVWASHANAVASSVTVAVAASSTGTIRGNARPHEQIVMVNAQSGAVVGVMSDSSGHFEAIGLPAGQYSVARAHAASKTTGAPVIAGRITDVALPDE